MKCVCEYVVMFVHGYECMQLCKCVGTKMTSVSVLSHPLLGVLRDGLLPAPEAQKSEIGLALETQIHTNTHSFIYGFEGLKC